MEKELNKTWRDYENGWMAACEEINKAIEARQKECSEELYWAGLEEAKRICSYMAAKDFNR